MKEKKLFVWATSFLCVWIILCLLSCCKEQGTSCSHSCGGNALRIGSNCHGSAVLQAHGSSSVFVHFYQFEALSVSNSVPCIVLFVIDQVNRFVFSFFSNGITIFVGFNQVFTVFSLYGLYFTNGSRGIGAAPEFDGIENQDIRQVGYLLHRENMESKEDKFVEKLVGYHLVPVFTTIK